RTEELEPVLLGHLIPLLARNDVFLDVLRALRRAAPRATGQLLDALLDPGQDVAVRRRIPRVPPGRPTPRAADRPPPHLAHPRPRVPGKCVARGGARGSLAPPGRARPADPSRPPSPAGGGGADALEQHPGLQPRAAEEEASPSVIRPG